MLLAASSGALFPPISVLTQPGLRTTTVTPLPRSSMARFFVTMFNAVLLERYMGEPPSVFFGDRTHAAADIYNQLVLGAGDIVRQGLGEVKGCDDIDAHDVEPGVCI